MIGIKGMELPKSCKECFLNIEGFSNNSYCRKTKLETTKYNNKRHTKCPLLDLGKEDMSWDELVEKVRNYNKIYIPNDISFIRLYQICFNRIGDIFFLNDKRLKKTPFQMYQIIKSLVGDER